MGLLVSHCSAMPGRRHWPDQSGYFDSSWAPAPAMVTHRAIAAMAHRSSIGHLRNCRASHGPPVSHTSFRRLSKIAQGGRRLIFPRRHQVAVAALEIELVAEPHLQVVVA